MRSFHTARHYRFAAQMMISTAVQTLMLRIQTVHDRFVMHVQNATDRHGQSAVRRHRHGIPMRTTTVRSVRVVTRSGGAGVLPGCGRSTADHMLAVVMQVVMVVMTLVLVMMGFDVRGDVVRVWDACVGQCVDWGSGHWTGHE